MSGADEPIAVYIPSETGEFDNEPCWCIECGWDGLEDDLTFTNDGVFVCPQCSSEDTDYFYSEEADSCVFCGSGEVVGVIDIVSLNEIHEATPLDKAYDKLHDALQRAHMAIKQHGDRKALKAFQGLEPSAVN